MVIYNYRKEMKNMTELKVKAWVIDKAQEEAKRFNTWIDIVSRNEENKVTADEQGYYTVIVEELIKETEKAVFAKLSSGSIVGSSNGWQLWIPKSQIKR